mmetsp:Transcript_25080/g.78664  ORF Transcript_25080/g.78664 Transcript_25080/m.78664 type:complete len:457 (+) Transcript_25080:77-1447(+)
MHPRTRSHAQPKPKPKHLVVLLEARAPRRQHGLRDARLPRLRRRLGLPRRRRRAGRRGGPLEGLPHGVRLRARVRRVAVAVGALAAAAPVRAGQLRRLVRRVAAGVLRRRLVAGVRVGPRVVRALRGQDEAARDAVCLDLGVHGVEAIARGRQGVGAVAREDGALAEAPGDVEVAHGGRRRLGHAPLSRHRRDLVGKGLRRGRVALLRVRRRPRPPGAHALRRVLEACARARRARRGRVRQRLGRLLHLRDALAEGRGGGVAPVVVVLEVARRGVRLVRLDGLVRGQPIELRRGLALFLSPRHRPRLGSLRFGRRRAGIGRLISPRRRRRLLPRVDHLPFDVLLWLRLRLRRLALLAAAARALRSLLLRARQPLLGLLPARRLVGALGSPVGALGGLGRDAWHGCRVDVEVLVAGARALLRRSPYRRRAPLLLDGAALEVLAGGELRLRIVHEPHV